MLDELTDVWHAAQAEAKLAYEDWHRCPCAEAYAVYRAAQDRADAAQDTLCRLSAGATARPAGLRALSAARARTAGASWDGGEQVGLTPREHRRLADRLRGAALDRRAVEPLSRRYPELTVGDAYRIGDMLVGRRIADGERLIGARVSLGSARTGRGLGAPEPRLGWLTDGMLLSSAVLDLGDLIRPRIEPRLAFQLSRPLREPVAAGHLLAATGRVLPCLEVLDFRFDGDGFGLADDIADNCGAARLLIGNGVPPPAEGHLLRVRARLHVDGAASETAGAPLAAVVSPLELATWLCNRLIQGGRPPGPGTLLVSPAGTGAVELVVPVRVAGRFRRLGSVELQAVGKLPPET